MLIFSNFAPTQIGYMVRKFLASFIVGVLLASCATANKTEPSIGLQGRWKLTREECKTGGLDTLGKAKQHALDSGATEEFYNISGNHVEYEMREHGQPDNPQSYCQTIYAGKMAADAGLIKKFSMTLQSRAGVGDDKCRPTHMPKISTADRDWPYEIRDGVLRITHRDIEAVQMPAGTISRFCDSASDVVMNYQRVQ